jgi:hypothetical protein
VVALIAIAVLLVIALAFAGGALGLFGWRVSADLKQREREGADPESLNWRARYFRGYPLD